jgi:hypothetical protein
MHKGLVSRSYKELSKLKYENNPFFFKWMKDLDTSPPNIHKVANEHVRLR